MSIKNIQDKLEKKLEEVSALVDALSVEVESDIDDERFNMIADIHKEKIENYILRHSTLFDTTKEVDLTHVSADRVLDYAFAFGELYNRMVGDKKAITKFWNRDLEV